MDNELIQRTPSVAAGFSRIIRQKTLISRKEETLLHIWYLNGTNNRQKLGRNRQEADYSLVDWPHWSMNDSLISYDFSQDATFHNEKYDNYVSNVYIEEQLN